MIYYVGIDLAEKDFTVSALTSPDALVFFGKTFDNRPQGFKNFHRCLKQNDIDQGNSHIIMEATGVYGEKLCRCFYDQGFRVHVEPALHIRRAFRLKRKNDRVDSRQIAEYGFRFSDQLHTWKPRSQKLDQLRAYLVNRELFTKEGTAHKNILKALEYKTDSLEHLHDQAIEFFVSQIKALDQAISNLLESEDDGETLQHSRNLLTIPSVGKLFVANFCDVTDGYTFIDYRSLAAYTGICPYEYESGSSVYRTPRSDKAGSDRMRKQLYLLAMRSIQNRGIFRPYYNRKRAEGKPGKLIMNNIQNKLLRLSCAIIHSGSTYNSQHRSIHPDILKK